ncbi:MAG TPA: AtpZ/AtpI family protein [Anaerolineae bacterium]|nr:AtpZ/AtpI family protein [Anaerolineae bacterium]
MSKPERDDKKERSKFWHLVGTMASLGWSLVLPIVGGAFLGHYLDQITDQGVKWTVGLLFLGVAMAFYNLYYILFRESND